MRSRLYSRWTITSPARKSIEHRCCSHRSTESERTDEKKETLVTSLVPFYRPWKRGKVGELERESYSPQEKDTHRCFSAQSEEQLQTRNTLLKHLHRVDSRSPYSLRLGYSTLEFSCVLSCPKRGKFSSTGNFTRTSSLRTAVVIYYLSAFPTRSPDQMAFSLTSAKERLVLVREKTRRL